MGNRTINMTTGSPAKHILNFAVPLILTNVGQQFYMIADAAIVGRGVGVKAFAAVGATDWCYWLILWTVGVLAAKPLLRVLNTPEDILSGASAYLTTMVAGTLIVMGYNMTAAILRSLGDGKTPLTAMIIAALLK